MKRRRFQRGSLFRKGKIWAARWWEETIGADGTPRRVRRFATFGEGPKREAQKSLERMLQPINGGKQRPQSAMTLDQFIRERWIPAEMPILDAKSLKLDSEAVLVGKDLGNRPGSAISYGSYLRLHLLPVFGQVPLNALKRWDIQNFLTGKLKKGYSGAHVHGMRTTLSKVLQAAVAWDLLEANPARGCHIANRQPTKARTYLTPEQVHELLAELPEPCRTVVLVAVCTGFRIGEILALRWGRVDFLHRTISVEESYSGTFGPPKTRSSRRVIPMSLTMQQGLERHRARSSSTGEQSLVFATSKGTPLSPKNLRNRVLEPTRAGLGLPRTSWHTFRYTLTTWLSEAGVAPRIAQSILGHSDVAMTLNVYTQVVPESQRAAMEEVAALLGTKRTLTPPAGKYAVM
jgi:integrase